MLSGFFVALLSPKSGEKLCVGTALRHNGAAP
jgi:hypothetical protein